MYWIAESMAEETPRKVAHEEIACGRGAGLEEGSVGMLASVVVDIKKSFGPVSSEGNNTHN
jgi:hypothetical protein